MNPVTATVKPHQGRPTLMLNGTPNAPLMYGLTDAPGFRWSREELGQHNIRLFAESGIRLFQLDIWFEQMIPDGSDSLDITLARKQIKGVLEVCPDAAVMLRLHVNATPRWIDSHPEELIGYGSTPPEPQTDKQFRRPLTDDALTPPRASFFSRVWKEWATGHLKTFCRELARTPEGDRLFGIQIANGIYGEWHMFGSLRNDPDTGPAATAAFRERLGDPSADVPRSAERETADCGIVRDPQIRRRVIDWFTFQHETTADLILHFAETIKAAWPRPIVTAAFYGYLYSMFGRHAAAGQLAVERLLASPHLDCLCAPQAYDPPARAPGGSGHSRGLADPVRRAGKLWLDEMDQATRIGCPWVKSFSSTPEEDAAVMVRNILQPLVHGGGAWWYDFGAMNSPADFNRDGLRGWWDDAPLQTCVAALKRLADRQLQLPFIRPADVLVVHDPMGFAHTLSVRHPDPDRPHTVTNPGDPVTPLCSDGLTIALHRSGMIFEEALLSELPTLDLTPYRLIVLATTPVLTRQERELLSNQPVVALGFCGWSNGTEAGPETASDFYGVPVRLQRQEKPALRIAEETVVLNHPFDLPVFNTTCSEAIGSWADGTTGAFSADSLQAFALPPQTPAAWREIGRKSGCHIVSDADDTILAGNGLLAVHSAKGGRRILHLPNGKTIATDLPPSGTSVFDLRSGEKLL